MNFYHTYAEIKSQPQAWQNALEVTAALTCGIRSFTDKYDRVIFSGCGSTFYLSLAGAALYQQLSGKVARAVPGSELLLNPSSVLEKDTPTLLIAISRSGTTSEIVKAVEQFKRPRNGDVITITNYDTDLAVLGDLSIILPAGQEESVAQTRSFSSMYVALNALCTFAARRDDLSIAMSRLPDVGQRLLTEYEGLAKEIGENLSFDRFYFLGSGGRYGLACEANLKMKEMTLTHSEPFHVLEFRHGPMSMVGKTAVVIGLLSEQNYEQEQAVVNEMEELGAHGFTLSESRGDVIFQSGIPEESRGVLYLPVLQLMAFYRSLAKGLNPDSPKNLTAVVTLDL